MTDFGRKQGDMLRSVYDPNKDGVLAVAQTEADMTKAVYDPTLATIVALLANHSAEHESGGDDEIDVTGLVGTEGSEILGDGTLGRVVRIVSLIILDAVDANKIRVRVTALWNGDAVADVTNIAKGDTSGHYNLSADGYTFKIAAAAFTGNVLFATASIYHDGTTLAMNIGCGAFESGMRFRFTDRDSAADIDITDLYSEDYLDARILYLTDA